MGIDGTNANTQHVPDMSALPSFRAGQPLISLSKTWCRQLHRAARYKKEIKKVKWIPSPPEEGHGEKIWIWSHRRTDQTVYTLRPRLDDEHELKQIPYNGKKLKPATLRKDYWSPMAILKFGQGGGDIGRSVFQKLRELKHLHEVNWPLELRIKPVQEYSRKDHQHMAEEKAAGRDKVLYRNKHQRGMALNAQRKNSIADMAAVLAGMGKGNAMNIKVKGEGEDAGLEEKLAQVTIEWKNDQDQQYAEQWTDNVTHALMEKPAYVLGTETQTAKPAPQIA